jgi:DNA-binding MarR family transcriptional regulator
MPPSNVSGSVEFARDFYQLLSRFVPGDTTVNELRVLTELALTSPETEEGTSVSKICGATGLAPATVSRLITKWIALDRIVESRHPEDGRRRVLRLNEESATFRKEWSATLERLLLKRDHRTKL